MCQGTEYDHIDEFIPGRVFGDSMCVSECTTLRKDAQECRQNGTGSSTVQDASVVLHAQRVRRGGRDNIGTIRSVSVLVLCAEFSPNLDELF